MIPEQGNIPGQIPRLSGCARGFEFSIEVCLNHFLIMMPIKPGLLSCYWEMFAAVYLRVLFSVIVANSGSRL